MATQITVAVSANGEVLASQAMRDGARADRLDSEATVKQAKKAAVEALDDETNGRNNKLGKYEPSRDPAAFARKGKLYGQFSAINLTFFHYPLRGTWRSARDAGYMTLNVRGITQEGSLKGPTAIELTRNINTEMFVVDAPAGYVNEQLLFGSPQGSNGFTPWPENGVAPVTQVWGQEGFNRYAVMAGSIRPSDGYFMEPFSLEYTELSARVMPAIDGISSYQIYEDVWAPYEGSDYPGNNDAYNPNIRANGRSEVDVQITGLTDFEKDPVHEFFMLPFNGETTFLVVIFTDYMIATGSWLQSTAIVSSELFAQWPNESGNPSTNEVTYERYRPNYLLPDGYTFPDFNLATGELTDGIDRPTPKITEEGANKIQTVRLYKMTDGVISEVQNVPEQLREAAGNLSTNLKDFSLSQSRQYPARRKYASEKIRAIWSGSGLVPEQLDGPDLSSWHVIDQSCQIMLDSSLKTRVGARRAYLGVETRQRSITKGYGIGKLSTTNHFDTPYIDSTAQGFWDDRYFTPMIYSYLKGSARPGMTYAQAAQGMPIDPDTGAPFELNTFVDHDGFGNIRFTDVQPTALNAAELIDSNWQPEPIFNLSTHQCWNWNRPDLCWDELNSLGFTSDLIGFRPSKP